MMRRHPLKLAVSGIYSEDVDATTYAVNTPFADLLKKEMTSLQFESAARMIIFHPIISNPEFGFNQDSIQYRNKESAVAVSVVISHTGWKGASKAERVDLFATALRQAIERIKEAKLTPDDKATLLAAVERTREEMRRRVGGT